MTVLQMVRRHGRLEHNNHVVGLVGDWIFDSNHAQALPLARGLDACCLGGKYDRVAYAARLKPGKTLKKEMKKKAAGNG